MKFSELHAISNKYFKQKMENFKINLITIEDRIKWMIIQKILIIGRICIIKYTSKRNYLKC